MGLRTKTKISPMYILPGDVLTVSESQVDEHGNAQMVKVFVSDEIERSISINKIVTFDIEKGDFGSDVVDGIGAAFLNVGTKKGK